MHCRKVRRYLFGYFKGELSSEEAGEVKAHLEGCPDCAKEAKEIELVSLMLKDEVETFTPSADFSQRLMARLQELPSEVDAGRERSWWDRLLHEVFPSVRLRWALAGAASVLVVAFAFMFTQRQAPTGPGYLSEGESSEESYTSASFQEFADSLNSEMWRRVAQASAVRDTAFIIDNLSFPASRGEDGAMRPEDLYKRFVIDRRSAWGRQAGAENLYVLPVVSTQPTSQKPDY
jgi:hypothetical protein